MSPWAEFRGKMRIKKMVQSLLLPVKHVIHKMACVIKTEPSQEESRMNEKTILGICMCVTEGARCCQATTNWTLQSTV